jgi:hypothetical protein
MYYCVLEVRTKILAFITWLGYLQDKADCSWAGGNSVNGSGNTVPQPLPNNNPCPYPSSDWTLTVNINDVKVQ